MSVQILDEVARSADTLATGDGDARQAAIVRQYLQALVCAPVLPAGKSRPRRPVMATPALLARHAEQVLADVPPVSDLPVVSETETTEHHEVGGWKGEGPGSCGVECACGVTFDHFDTLAEASALLEDHITRAAADKAKVEQMAQRLADVLQVGDVRDAVGVELYRMAGIAVDVREVAETRRALDVQQHPAWCDSADLHNACGHNHLSKWVDVAATFDKPRFGDGTAEFPVVSAAARLVQDPDDIVGPDTDGEWYGTESVSLMVQRDSRWAQVDFTPAEWQRFVEVAETAKAMAVSDPELSTRQLPADWTDVPQEHRDTAEREPHPWWCDGPVNCGVHRSTYTIVLASAHGVEAADEGALVPAVSVAVERDERGRVGVVLVFPKVEVTVLVDELDELIEAGNEAHRLVVGS